MIPLPAWRIANWRTAVFRSLCSRGCQVFEVIDDPPHLRPAAHAGNALVEPRREGVQDHPVMVHQSDERQRGGHLLAVMELRRRAEVHGQAGIEQGVDVQIFFLEEELEEEPVEPSVDVPVDVPQIVADGIVAVLGKLDGRAPPLALALALHAADDDFAADQLRAARACAKNRGRATAQRGSRPGHGAAAEGTGEDVAMDCPFGARAELSNERTLVVVFIPSGPRSRRGKASGGRRGRRPGARAKARPRRSSSALSGSPEGSGADSPRR